MRNRSRSRSQSSQVILGVGVIAMGVLFLCDNLNIFSVRDVFQFWPTVLILLGCVKLGDTRTTSGAAVGGALILAGALLTLNRLGYIYFNMRSVWPLVLIVFGALLVSKAVGNRNSSGEVPVVDGSDEVINFTALLGGIQRRITTQNFRGGEITAFMGGVDLDLRSASIEKEAVINVFAAMGGISLKVPPDWTVVLQGTPVMGGFDEKTIEPKDGSKRLVIKGYAIMGGVEVRN
jgi:predicted membrane protein